MPTRHDIVTFHEVPVPPGESPWVAGAEPLEQPEVVEPDPSWPSRYDEVAGRVRGALGWRVLQLQHVGSTSVPGLAAKPVIDLDLVVADPDDEPAYLPALLDLGLEHRVREPWWFGHRCLRGTAPLANLHVFGPDSPEPVRHRLFRDWLRGHDDERDLYAAAKREAAAGAVAAGENVAAYNARKEQVIREIHARLFTASGLTVTDR